MVFGFLAHVCTGFFRGVGIFASDVWVSGEMYGLFQGARVFQEVLVYTQEVRVYILFVSLTNPNILGYKKDFPFATTFSFQIVSKCDSCSQLGPIRYLLIMRKFNSLIRHIRCGLTSSKWQKNSSTKTIRIQWLAIVKDSRTRAVISMIFNGIHLQGQRIWIIASFFCSGFSIPMAC